MKTIEEYALDLIADGTASLAEDDLNEDEEIEAENHYAACQLAQRIARAVKNNPDIALALVAQDELKAIKGHIATTIGTLERLKTASANRGAYPEALAYNGAVEQLSAILRNTAAGEAANA